MNSIKIGSKDPKAIMFANRTIYEHTSLTDYYKFANDAGGYYVHGLWLAPTNATNNYKYSWPWDLSIPNGALKDKNDGFRYWGYVNDGCNKNITKGMKVNFPANGWSQFGIGITLYYNTPNYIDEQENECLDFGDHPIIIEFRDDRFDNYTWESVNGSVYEWSEDKRAITIHRVGPTRTVCVSNVENKSIDFVRQQLTNVFVDLIGMSFHSDSYQWTDPSNSECFDVYNGTKPCYHKEKTFDNCWMKYGLIDEKKSDNLVSQYFDSKIHSLCTNNTNLDSSVRIKLPMVSDWKDKIKVVNNEYGQPNEWITWNVKALNEDDWKPIIQWYKDNTVTNDMLRSKLFTNSNIREVVINLDNGKLKAEPVGIEEAINWNIEYAALSDFLSESKIRKLTMNLADEHHCVSSGNCLFHNAHDLKEIIWNGNPILARDLSGFMEFCFALETFPPNLVAYHIREQLDNGEIPATNAGFTFEGSALVNIPIAEQANGERENDKNVLLPHTVTQLFNGANRLKYVGPVIDMILIDPSDASQCFATDSITDIRIRNLNHGNWNLDGVTRGVYHGNLLNLDADSVAYLLYNLYDLKGYTGEVSEFEYTTTPKVQDANLYCPSAWSDKITDDMVLTANERGWTIYVGGEIFKRI